ncbi:MAG: septal ring lytic transglycosylase RlpA family protein [Pseudomonadota bacterium]
MNSFARPRSIAFAASLALTLLIATGCASTARPPSSSGSSNSNVSRAGNAPFYVVHGRRYYVMSEAGDYRERGVASWYGPKFHGRPTASGEVFDMHQLTAAHKTLPIPTYVRVRNLSNGRTVVVRVNDRGPFVKNRLIDLSQEAARRLGLIGPGTGLVDVQVVPAPEAAQTARTRNTPSRAPPEVRGLTTFFVQVGAFSDGTNAERMRQRLLGLGFSNVVVHRSEPPEPAFRVRVGPFSDVRAYDDIVERMRLANITDTFLTGY